MTSILKRIRTVGLFATVVIGAACGTDPGDGGGGGGSIAITVTPGTLTIQQGGTGSVAATITRSGGFTGAVTIVTEGAPAGVTAAVSGVTTTGGTTSGTVNVTVAASVAPGTYPLTIRATGNGVPAQTFSLTLIVTAAPAISLSMSPASLNLNQGASGTSTVTIARTNFTGTVTLALEGAPTGVTGTFNPASGTGTTSTLTVQVGASVTPGTYPLTVRGTGTGVTAATAPLSLVVSAPQAEGSFEITTIAPDPKSIAQGASGDVTVTLARTNFTGAVNLTLEGAPTGVTGTFSPAAATGTSSVLTLAVGATVPAANYTLTVRGTGTGVTAKTKTFVLTVTAVVPSSFSIALGSAAVSVQQNAGTVNVSVTITRVNFAGAVSLAVTGTLPAGLTATVTPSSTTGNTATLALSATTAVTLGSYQLSIAGTATGAPNASSPVVNVTVTAASGGSGNVTIDYSACDVDERPLWLAFQNGTGAWTRVTPTGNVYSFNISAGKGGVAVVTGSGSGNSVAFFYFTQAEMVALSGASFCGDTPTAGKSVLATMVNLGPTQFATVSLGGGSGGANFAMPIATLHPVANGTFDMIAYAGSLLGAGGGDRVGIRRDINTSAIAEGASVGSPMDLTGSESAAAATATVTVNGLGAGETIMSHSMSYTTGASCTQGNLYFTPGSAGSSFTAYGVPAGMQRGTDFHNIAVNAGNTSSFRSVFQSFQALTNRTIDLPPALTTTVTVGTGPYKILRFQFTLPAALSASASMGYFTSGGVGAGIFASSGWLGGTTVDLTVPDLSGVDGWTNAWMPPPPASVSWSALASGFHSGTNNCSASTYSLSTQTGTI